MHAFPTSALLVIALATLSASPAVAAPPAPAPREAAAIKIDFKQACGLPEGRQQAYDPATGIVHVHFWPQREIGGFGSGFYKRSMFEVTRATGPFAKPIVFRLTGVPANYGCLGDPLTLSVGGPVSEHLVFGKRYALVEDPLAVEPIDKSLVRVERNKDAVTVTFTEKGQSLVKPGTVISFKLDHGW